MADIISSGTSKPTNLAITRSGNSMELKWGIPLNLVDDSFSGPKITFIDVWWAFNASKNMDSRWTEVRYPGTALADKTWIRDLGTSARSHTQGFDRSKYHPVTDGRFMGSVTGWVQVNGADVKTSYTFAKPSMPVLGSPTYDDSSNTVSFSYECPDDEGYLDGANTDHERYDVRIYAERQDDGFPSPMPKVLLTDEPVREDSYTYTTDPISGADSLEYGQAINIRFWAKARGLAGDSDWAYAEYTIAHPTRATVEGFSVDEANDLVTVKFRANWSPLHPEVGTIELQRLADTTIWTAAAAKQASGWSTVGDPTDDKGCTGLVDHISEARPSRGHYTFYRIKTSRCGYTQYSEPVRAIQLERFGSPVEDDSVQIHSVTPQEDGTSIKVVLAWTWEHDDSNGTEVSWSEYADAWQSTVQPNTYDLDDSRRDNPYQVPGKATATLVIRDLEEGKPYYIKARRYQDNGDDRIYGTAYSTAPAAYYPVSPKTEATGVHLSAPTYIGRGDGCTLTWTFDSESEQKSWNLYRVWDETVGGETAEQRVLVGSGEDQTGSAVVGADQMGVGDTASFVVAITTGGEWSESNRVTVTMADPPVLELGAIQDLTAQPLTFSFTCDSTADVVAKVTSDGTASGTPDGEMVQAEGDVIWSERIEPAWEMGQDNLYHAEAVLPTGMPFLDGTGYKVAVVAVDDATGLKSSGRVVGFSVDWAHKAAPPDPSSTVTPDKAGRTARVHPVKPSGAAQTDRYDLYRVSNDSVDLIAEGQEFGIDAVDRYAPYSTALGLVYRIATRTADGDVQWADFEYEMPVGVMCFDWGDDGHLELPYNIALQDSYEKNYESHQHMDGSVSGHWNPGFQKTGTYSTDIIKINDADQVKLVRDMATYPGPVFVRTQDGGAFEANVTLGVDTAYSSGAVGVSLNVQAHSLSDAFRLGPDDFIDTTGA